MHAIDTSLLYALFNANDQWHEEAKTAVQEQRPVLVPPGILQETMDLLRLRHGAKAAAAALAWLQATGQLDLSGAYGDESLRAAVSAYEPTIARRLSFADAWCVAHALHHGATLLTRDADQVKAAKDWQSPS
ncbi:MAG: PIN domain-containing protein [Thermoplasmatota archaeon]